jgi:hypothetical protein
MVWGLPIGHDYSLSPFLNGRFFLGGAPTYASTLRFSRVIRDAIKSA